MALWRRAGQFDARSGSLLTWLLAIARHRAIDRLRAEGRRPGTRRDPPRRPDGRRTWHERIAARRAAGARRRTRHGSRDGGSRRWVQAVVRTGISELPGARAAGDRPRLWPGPLAEPDRGAARMAARHGQVADPAGHGPAPNAGSARWSMPMPRAARLPRCPLTPWTNPPGCATDERAADGPRRGPRADRGPAPRAGAAGRAWAARPHPRTWRCASTSPVAPPARADLEAWRRLQADGRERAAERRDARGQAAAVEPMELPPSLRARVIASVADAAPGKPVGRHRAGRRSTPRGPSGAPSIEAGTARRARRVDRPPRRLRLVTVDQIRQRAAAEASASSLQVALAAVDRMLATDHKVVALRDTSGGTAGTISWSRHDWVVLTTALERAARRKHYRCWLVENGGQSMAVGQMEFSGGIAFWATSVDAWQTWEIGPTTQFIVSLESGAPDGARRRHRPLGGARQLGARALLSALGAGWRDGLAARRQRRRRPRRSSTPGCRRHERQLGLRFEPGLDDPLELERPRRDRSRPARRRRAAARPRRSRAGRRPGAPAFVQFSRLSRSNTRPGRYSSDGQCAVVWSAMIRCWSDEDLVDQGARRQVVDDVDLAHEAAAPARTARRRGRASGRQKTSRKSSIPGPDTELTPASAASSALPNVSAPACASTSFASDRRHVRLRRQARATSPPRRRRRRAGAPRSPPSASSRSSCGTSPARRRTARARRASRSGPS